jgi:TRAP-type mannitol/chloroaromatic compound transport system permease small subunit
MSAEERARANPPGSLLRVVRAINRFSEWTGMAAAWLMLPLVCAVAYEVVARYAFSAPTIWSYDLTYMFYGTIFMVGAAYTLRVGAHIRTDFFWEKWSVRTKAVIDAVTYVVFFFPGIVLFLAVGLEELRSSYEMGETSEQTPWRPPLWPLKAMVPLAAVLLLVQGVAELLKSLHAWRTGTDLEPRRRIEE